MNIKEYIKSLGINKEGVRGDNNSYIIDLIDSTEFGKIFTKLDKITSLDPLEDNQVVTEQGTSLIYEDEENNYLLNLIADFEGDVYQLVINNIEDDIKNKEE